MRYSAAIIITLLLLTCAARESQAQGIPVYDAAGFTQVLTQLNQMAKEYQKQIEQLDQAIKQTSAITGTRNMGSVANSALEKKLRRYLPGTWQQTMTMIQGGQITGSAANMQRRYKEFYTLYKPSSGAAFIPADPQGPIAQALERRTGTTYAAMAASEQAYNNIPARIATFEGLLNELNNTNDLKASVDLQTRILAENGMVLNELIRLGSISMQQKAAQDNEVLTTYRRASSANKYNAARAAATFKLQE